MLWTLRIKDEEAVGERDRHRFRGWMDVEEEREKEMTLLMLQIYVNTIKQSTIGYLQPKSINIYK